jgi:AraC-like DNA-binding protein
MPKDFSPMLTKMYVFKKHTMLMIQSGEGIFQVDFKNYNFSAGQSIFLSPGQYFQLLSGRYTMLQYEFDEKDVRHIENSRFLFKHLVSIGHIDAKQTDKLYKSQLRNIDVCETNASFLSRAIDGWLELNPFNTTGHDINLLFDLKEIIDENYMEPVSLAVVSKKLDKKPYHVDTLLKEKLEDTLHHLTAAKVLLETKRKIVFTELTTKEIAYSTGYKDPDYFNRVFKKQTNFTPLEFRKKYDFNERDTFINDLLQLIDTNYKEQHFATFYANELSITVKTLSNRIAQKLATNFTHLISEKLLQESKLSLKQGMPINKIAFFLGFKEPNHFSAFFRKLTSKTPTQFLADL